MSNTEIGVVTFVFGWAMFAAGYAIALLNKSDNVLKVNLRLSELEYKVFAATQFLVRIKKVLNKAERYDDGSKAVVEDIKRIMKDIPPAWAGIFQEESCQSKK